MTRIRETAGLLLGLGTVLLLPPVALIFAKPVNLWGIPLPVLYLSGVWLVLILSVWILSRRLPPGSSE